MHHDTVLAGALSHAAGALFVFAHPWDSREPATVLSQGCTAKLWTNPWILFFSKFLGWPRARDDYRVLNPSKNMGDHIKTVSIGIFKYNHPKARRTHGHMAAVCHDVLCISLCFSSPQKSTQHPVADIFWSAWRGITNSIWLGAVM